MTPSVTELGVFFVVGSWARVRDGEAAECPQRPRSGRSCVTMHIPPLKVGSRITADMCRALLFPMQAAPAFALGCLCAPPPAHRTQRHASGSPALVVRVLGLCDLTGSSASRCSSVSTGATAACELPFVRLGRHVATPNASKDRCPLCSRPAVHHCSLVAVDYRGVVWHDGVALPFLRFGSSHAHAMRVP